MENNPTVSRDCLRSVDIYILAGGLGTRIRPVLGDVPKLLAPIRRRTYLDYLLDWLRQFGARRIVLGLGHAADAIKNHLAAHPPPNLTIVTVVEPRPLGTAGAIRFARAQFHTDPVLVLNGDTFADADLCKFLISHRQAGARGTMLCTKVLNSGRYGRVLIDENGLINGYVEKDPTWSDEGIINAGIYLFSAALLDDIAAGGGPSLENDVFSRLKPGSLAAFTECANFVDIGTPESFALVNKSARFMISSEPRD
jgi:NDP-sugar pyrophosphorylase family protein